MTIAAPGHSVPCCCDREILLYLCALASSAGWSAFRVSGSVRDLRGWLGARRQAHRAREHLERVAGCTIMWMRQDGGHQQIDIGRLEWTDSDRFTVTFGREFLHQCRAGIPYSLDIATELRSQPATLDLYLALVGFIRDVRAYREFTHEFPTGQRLPLAADTWKARQALGKRLRALRGILPEVYLTMTARGTGLLVDIGEPKRTTKGGASREGWNQHEQFGRIMRTMAPEDRRVFGQAVQLLTEHEKRLCEPDRWGEAQQLLETAGAQTARVFEDVEAYSANLAALAGDRP